MQQNAYKQDSEYKMKSEEQQQDRHEYAMATQTRDQYKTASNLNKYYAP